MQCWIAPTSTHSVYAFTFDCCGFVPRERGCVLAYVRATTFTKYYHNSTAIPFVKDKEIAGKRKK